jgi:hypothetical protein
MVSPRSTGGLSPLKNSMANLADAYIAT